MTIETVLQHTTIDYPDAAQRLTIENALRAMYRDSATGKAMLDKVTAAFPLEIKHVAGQARAFTGAGKVELDFSVVNELAYFDANGRGVAFTIDHALRHELVHALQGLRDSPRGTLNTDNAKGPTLVFEKAINDEMSQSNRLSYEGVDVKTALVPGTNYTGGAAIDIALARQGFVDTSGAGQATKDLLWGRGTARDHFKSGAGTDFLYGNGGDDILDGGGGNDSINGGAGTDRAVFSGKCSDYTITANANGTITFVDNRANSPDGTDTLRDVEYARFADGEMNLTTGEFACPGQNVVIVIDKTGSMSDDIAAAKASAIAIANALFGTDDKPIASTLAIVTYWDSNTVTNLQFTKQDRVADRKAAALAALNGLSESTSGGTENLNTALLHAIDGNAGTWDTRNKSNKIIVFTDEDADDPQLRATVVARALAGDIAIPPSPSSTGSGAVAAPSTPTGGLVDYTDAPFFDPYGPGAVQVLPVVIGTSSTANADLQNLADQTNGQVFNVDASNPAQAAASVIAAISATSGTDGPDSLSGDENANAIGGLAGNDTIEGLGGNDTLTGGPGDDILRGGDGDDVLRGSAGYDTADGGNGNDTLVVNADSADVNLAGTAGALVIQSVDGDVAIIDVETVRFLNGSFNTSSIEFLRGQNTFGTEGADTMNGDENGNRLWGRGGNDVLNGLAGNDTLRGNAGNDRLSGGEGDDVLVGGDGNDTVDGGAGNDIAEIGFARADVTVDGPADALTIETRTGVTTLIGIEQVRFTDGLDAIADVIAMRDRLLMGTSGDDVLVGGFGNDTISGQAGNDLLMGGPDNDQLFSGPGRDTLMGGGGDDLLEATSDPGATLIPAALVNPLTAPAPLPENWSLAPSPDVENPTTVPHQLLRITGSGDTHEAFRFAATAGQTWTFDVDGASFDSRLTLYDDAGGTIVANDDSSTSLGAGGSTSGLDSYISHDFTADGFYVIALHRYGGGTIATTDTANLNISATGATVSVAGADPVVLFGDFGNDTLIGGGAADELDGGVGDDLLDGRQGNDRVIGDAGNDTLRGGDGADTLNGGDGDDIIFGGETDADLRDVIYGGNGNDRIDAGHGNDQVYGGEGNDTIEGGFGVDTIEGQAGDDVLTGSAFSDLVFGGDGNDFVNGGFGSDRVNGGAGADRFYHLGIADHGSDWIQDYSAADGDRLLFGGAGATRAQFQVNLTETAGAGAAGVDEAFVIYRPTGQILWALVDGGAQASINLQIGGQVFDLMA
jgi:Ca2+-binding RTX toxin-like protein